MRGGAGGEGGARGVVLGADEEIKIRICKSNVHSKSTIRLLSSIPQALTQRKPFFAAGVLPPALIFRFHNEMKGKKGENFPGTIAKKKNSGTIDVQRPTNKGWKKRIFFFY